MFANINKQFETNHQAEIPRINQSIPKYPMSQECTLFRHTKIPLKNELLILNTLKVFFFKLKIPFKIYFIIIVL